MDPLPEFPSGTLWQDATQRSARALDSGAQLPIATETEVVIDGGVGFVVHLLSRLEHKQRATVTQRRSAINPFLPPDPELVVAEVSPTHLAVLNKFNVLNPHLLVITRAFVDQESPLDEADFDALWRCLDEGDALGFYNSGTIAGASQAHKHLQLVPLPLVPGDRGAPVEALLEPALEDAARSTAFPFFHALAELDLGTAAPASVLHAIYHQLCRELGLDLRPRPYNLLVTRRWMLVVPRSAEHFEQISVNALGFAGSLLVRDRLELDRVREIGPMRVLGSVAET